MKQVPDHTAVRVALWRALHVQIDAAPHVLDDEIGLKMSGLDDSWRQRPDMNPGWTAGYRAAIVARARFIEDLVETSGVGQYVILGAGLDSFAQRRKPVSLKVFEIDQPETQAWKRQRLMELGYGIPEFLKLVPVDFEAGESWLEKLKANGFDAKRPSVVASTGVAMYLTKEANMATLKMIASLAKGTTLAMTFMLPSKLVPEKERAQYEMVQERAAASGTPFFSFWAPEEMLTFAQEAGFREVKHVSREELIRLYFSKRSDGLVPASGEEFLTATT